MEEELGRHRCVGDDGGIVTVIEARHVDVIPGASGTRVYPGARRLALSTGEAVRYIDSETFEVIDSGELLRRQP
jgi:hypothetical protein